MKRAKAAIDMTVGWVLVVLMAASVVNVLWQVFTRFVLGAPSSVTEELARYLLIWIGVLGAGYAVGQRAHLALELLPEKLTGARRRMLEVIIQGCVILFAAFVVVLGGMRLVFVQLQLGQTSPSLGLPLGWVYLVVPLSGLLMIFYAVFHVREGPSSPSDEDVLRLHGGDAASDRSSPEAQAAVRDGRTGRETASSATEKNQSLTDL